MMEDLTLETKILVAVSGGADSVYMLRNLNDRGYKNLGIAHFNHMIRADSEKDADLVRRLADSYQFPFHYTEYDIPTAAENKKQSIELVARDARRHFFETIMAMNSYEWLALGHHADDQAETVLYNFMRGTGVHGLAGMLRVDEKQKIYRPLLHMTKYNIYQLARGKGLKWVEDSTNHGFDNDRAWLRNFIIPKFEERRAGTKNVLADTAERFQELSEFLKDTAAKWLKYNEEDFSVAEFNSLRNVLQGEVIGALWEKYNGSRKDFNNKVVFEVTKWLTSDPQGGTKVYFGKGQLTLKQGRIFFEEKESDSV